MSTDPLEPLLQFRKRLDRLDRARSETEALAEAPRLLEGLIPFRAACIYRHAPAAHGWEAADTGSAEVPVPPKVLDWAAAGGEPCSVPVEGSSVGKGPLIRSFLLAPIPGQFKALGVLALASDQDAGELDRTAILILSLLGRELGRVLENLRVYERMQRLRELLDNIVESVPHGILAIGPDDAILSCNRNSEVLFGVKRIEVLGERYREALPKPLAEALSALMLDVLGGQVTRDLEFEHTLAGGEALPVGISCSLLRDKDGRPQGYLMICRDLSLTMEVQKLRELDRMKSEFVHTVSHELKTPLTAILGGAEVLQLERDSFTDDQREMLDIIDQGGRRLHALITDLLDLSRLESGRVGIEREETELGPALTEAAQNVRHKNPKCTLTIDIDPALPKVMADGDKLKQVFENLVGNALKYSPDGGEVRARLAVEGDNVRFAVTDQGIGIAPEHISQLFEKFFRVDSSTTAKIEGTGLGLTIVKHIVELHGGEVTVESVLGKGSTFGFRIPLVAPAT